MTAATTVILRPVTADDLQLFEREFSSEEAPAYISGSASRPRSTAVVGWAENGLLGSDGGILTVVAAGEAAGLVEWFRSAWGPQETSSCWTIAAGLRPTFRHRGFGTEAQHQLVDYLFSHTRAARLQAYTDLENEAEQRALQKAGFGREGVLRCARWRQGAGTTWCSTPLCVKASGLDSTFPSRTMVATMHAC